MRLSKGRTIAYSYGRRVRRGFTLVELIVVLTILAILAAIGVGSAVSYINRSKFDKNSQSAVTVYQTAQTALSQKASNGSIDMWIRTLKTNDGTTFISRLNTLPLDQSNESVNTVLSLTYNPGSDSIESQELYQFLSSYFYDMSVFQGTITVEFDVSATYTVDSPSYTARVISAFYSAENAPTGDLRWDDICTNHGATSDGLPYRDAAYRYQTSHVGYFNGTEESIKPQIASVFLPQSQVYELDGHIIGPTEDPTAQATGFLFNMRNSETLDISWAIFDEDGEGRTHDSHNEELTITLIDSGINNAGTHGNVVITVTNDSLSSLRYRSMAGSTRVVHEHVNNYDITRTSYDSFITVSVKNGTSAAVDMTFPITVTLVEGDGRTGCPKKLDGESIDAYYEYSISIDCMMARSNESETNTYNIRRLFGTNPTNIIATISGSVKYYDATGVLTSRAIPSTYAARAINDPVYYTGLNVYASNTSYCYDVRPMMAVNDQLDYDHTITGEPITGKCVVNTMFGDATYSSSASMSAGQTIAATQWGNSGGNAVVTSFRHLYNIRWIPNGKTVNYRIIRDLNWYINERGKLPVSEVRVYNLSRYYSPATAGQISVVSFPALGVLNNGQTLAAMPRSGGAYYSINNVQMRLASFTRGTDAGYGLICKNSGTIVDVHTNNLNLVLANLADGGNDLETNIFVNSINITGQTGGSGDLGNYDRPVGGLVGLNSGVVGQTDGSIVMSNSVVMGNRYWAIYGDVNKIATGGVIGKNESAVEGTVEINGSFAVVGRDNVGGVIGYSTANIAARLQVNRTEAPEAAFTLPIFNNTALGGHHMSSAIISKNCVGAAIGQIQNAALTLTSNPFTESATPENGLFSSVNRDNFQIDVTLNENSLIFMLGTFNTNNDNEKVAAGGAIGFMNATTGTAASIRVRNSGSIIVNDTSSNIYCGGVIGRDYNCSTTNVYIDFDNEIGRIGHFTDTTGPLATGGAYGHIQCSKTDRTIYINGVNGGTLVSRGNADGQGTGGAIGGISRIGNTGVSITFRIDVTNNASSRIIGIGSNQDNANGVGGAIGAMGNKDSNDGSKITTASIIRAVNRGTINGCYHVGGTIGNAVANYGQLYGVTSGSIYGNNFVGGVVGRDTYSNYGTVQSVLETNAYIKGQRFTGGAAGRILNDQNDTIVRTIVRGNATVFGDNGSLVGGVCGDISIAGTGTNINVELVGDGSAPTLTVTGNDGIGGVAGILRANVANSATVKTPDQSETNKLNLIISGQGYVGGALGALRSSSNNGNTPADVLTANAQGQAIKVNVTVVLSADSKITGTGDYVGGAIGYINSANSEYSGRIEVSFAGSSQSASYIVGRSHVGGAIGRVHNTKLMTNTAGTAGIVVDFGVNSWRIEGTIAASNDANVGGAVGSFDRGNASDTSDTGYTITVNLSTSNVTALGRNVGGAIGNNYGYNGNVTVTALAGTVSGQINVGGAIGKNNKAINEVTVTILESGNVLASGESETTSINGPSMSVMDANAGGAIGYAYASVNKITATVSGHVTGNGNNVGGAVGCVYATDKNQLLRTVSATLQNTGKVQGADNVGGAIGINVSNVDTVISEITGSSQVIGVNRVGGAVGFASATAGVGGGTVLAGNSCGRILYVSATISADLALVGSTQIGGAIGQVGNKWGGGNSYISAVVVRVQAVINAGRLFDTAHTGPSNASDDARVGGVVGHFVDGRLGMPVSGQSYDADHTPGVYLRGSGGVVHTDYPNRTYNNTVLMAANGSTIGGIIGQIGLEGYQQNACVTTISADGGPYLCVASVNGGNRVGGWIGAGYAAHGGIGNENNTSNPVTYNVNNVRTVYSTGDEVGGFMGRLDSLNGNSTSNKGIYARIVVSLSEANVTGRTQVGGVFGSFNAGWYAQGSISVTLSNHSNIGDITGNPMPGDTTTYDPICYECGGAIGFVNSQNTGNYLSRLYIPISVTSDATSRIWAGGTTNDAVNPVTNFGVGGAFGRIYASMNGSTRVEVQSSSNNPDPVYVYSAYSNVGGIAGVWIDRGMITDAGKTDVFKENTTYVLANVNVVGAGSDIGVGGFAGRINNGYVIGCRISGYVSSTGSNSNTGGFAGYIAGGTLKFDCTTTRVNSTSAGTGSTGGFVGYLAKGSISNSYVGGHTFQQQFISGEGNITGINNVGGFVGTISGDSSNTTIATCYSTASVLGTGQNIGGFVGNARKGKITSCYCSGLVTGSTNVGAYAGSISADMTLGSGDGNQALRGINGGSLELVGGEDPRTTGVTFADASAIRNGANHTAHAFDSQLPGTFELRGVINGEHYGDWSLGSPSGTSIENATVTIDSLVPDHANQFPYRREGVTIADANITVVVEGARLTYGEDFVLDYRNNDRIGMATVLIAGQGRYTGAISRTFEIVAADITSAELTLNTPEMEYDDGAPITPDITVKLAGEILAYNVDYYFTYNPDNTNIGTVEVTVHGIGNYVGTAANTVTFEIVGRDISGAAISANTQNLVYTGVEITPTVNTVRLGGVYLVEGTDYEVSYENNISAGNETAAIVITGINSYRGTAIQKFSILQATNSWVENANISDWTWGDTRSIPTGRVAFGEVEFAYYSDAALQNEIDITQAGAGTYYMKAFVTETADYTAPTPQVVSFTINRADISSGATVVIEPAEYACTGNPITPTSITVTVGSVTLTPETDYTVEYPSDITSAGDKTITITGVGNYMGTTTGTYTIYNVFTVSYATGYGSPVDPEDVREGQCATRPANPTYAGYDFRGWYTSSSCYPDELFDFDNTPVTGNITLYAKWQKVYVVTFINGDGAEPPQITQIVDDSSPAVEPTDPPTRTGYDFNGWYNDPACTVPYDFATLIHQDHNIYAGWIDVLYTVTFDTGEGGSSVDPQTVREGGTVTAPADPPTREGYTFQYWSTSADEGAAAYDFSAPVTGPLTLYAHWQED